LRCSGSPNSLLGSDFFLDAVSFAITPPFLQKAQARKVPT
jgi:hypothetical protein